MSYVSDRLQREPMQFGQQCAETTFIVTVIVIVIVIVIAVAIAIDIFLLSTSKKRIYRRGTGNVISCTTHERVHDTKAVFPIPPDSKPRKARREGEGELMSDSP
ncbi:hypothetical protein F5B18DRAFT_647155 [Nemania serpens]|nr:hypothetical protein F5B18DRAFT_647155 [Nemania serpens]